MVRLNRWCLIVRTNETLAFTTSSCFEVEARGKKGHARVLIAINVSTSREICRCPRLSYIDGRVIVVIP